MTGQFTPLTSFLERANRETVELTFDELEDVLGRPLSKSARTHRAWWSNSGHAHAITWTGAGYRVERPDLARGIVRFVRSRGPRPEFPERRNAVSLHENTRDNGRKVHQVLFQGLPFGAWKGAYSGHLALSVPPR